MRQYVIFNGSSLAFSIQRLTIFSDGKSRTSLRFRFASAIAWARLIGFRAKVRSDERREIRLVDDQQVAARDAGTTLARHLVAPGDVDDVDADVDELGAERGGEIVATGFEKHDLDVGKPGAHLVERLVVDRRILADGRVRAAAGLHAEDALDRQRAGAHQELGVLVRVDVVRDDGDAPRDARLRRPIEAAPARRPSTSCPSPDRCRRLRTVSVGSAPWRSQWNTRSSFVAITIGFLSGS